MGNPAVQIEQVAKLERALADARKRAADALRSCREAKGLSLRKISPAVELSPAALSLLERGETWETGTARRVAAAYSAARPEAAKAA